LKANESVEEIGRDALKSEQVNKHLYAHPTHSSAAMDINHTGFAHHPKRTQKIENDVLKNTEPLRRHERKYFYFVPTK
jgi:hypothetical protein